MTDEVTIRRSFFAPKGKRGQMHRYFHNTGRAYGLSVFIGVRDKNDPSRMTVTFKGVPNGYWGGVDALNRRLDLMDWSSL